MSIEPPRPVGERHTISRRRMLAYLVAAPTLTMVVKTVDDLVGSAVRPAPRPAPADVVDLSDALTLAALPTAYLLKIEITDGRPRRRARPPRRGRPGHHHRDGDHRGRGARREPRPRRRRARRRPSRAALEPAHRRVELGALAVHADAHGRGRGAGAARHRGRGSASASPPRRSSTRSSTVVAPDGRIGHVRLAVGRGRAGRRAGGPRHAEARAAFTQIGQPTTRLDARDIVTGRAEYALDLDVPGAPTVVARPPTIGGTVRSVDDTAARAMPGVLGVARIPSGVAVAADTFDQAQAARDALRITWDPGPNAGLSDAQIRAQLAGGRACRSPRRRSAVLAIDRTFDFAFAPHAPARGAHLRRRRPRRPRRDLVRRQEPDRREPAGRRGDRPARDRGHAARRSAPAARSATASSSSRRSRPRRSRRRSAARSS